jgi:hypothetical protein
MPCSLPLLLLLLSLGFSSTDCEENHDACARSSDKGEEEEGCRKEEEGGAQRESVCRPRETDDLAELMARPLEDRKKPPGKVAPERCTKRRSIISLVGVASSISKGTRNFSRINTAQKAASTFLFSSFLRTVPYVA